MGNPLNVINSPSVVQVQIDEEMAQLSQTMCQMKNEIIKLRRGDDLSSGNAPQGVGAPKLGFESKIDETQCNEISPTINIAPQPHVLNVVSMDEPVEDQMELDKNLQEHEVIL